MKIFNYLGNYFSNRETFQEIIVIPVFATLLAIFLGLLLLIVSGSSNEIALKALIALFYGSFGSISSISEALDRGRAVLRNVVIPQNVSERIADLDGNPRSRSWGRSIWGALLAFNVFAESEFSGNFLKWCATSGDPFAWHAQNISMRESDTVHNTERLRNQRVLPVSTEIDPSGRAFMEAHLKFGGSTAPRLYFLDDTKGRTGKIHIGGLDPHSRWENTTT